MKAVWGFAGTIGGGGVLEVESHEELDAIMARFPFAPFSSIEIIAIAPRGEPHQRKGVRAGDDGRHGQPVGWTPLSTLRLLKSTPAPVPDPAVPRHAVSGVRADRMSSTCGGAPEHPPHVSLTKRLQRSQDPVRLWIDQRFPHIDTLVIRERRDLKDAPRFGAGIPMRDRQTLPVGPVGTWFEHDDRGGSGPQGCPCVVVVAELTPAGPEPITLVTFRGATADRTKTVLQLDDLSGCAWRFSHHAGSASAQPFMARVTRFGPSSK